MHTKRAINVFVSLSLLFVLSACTSEPDRQTGVKGSGTGTGESMRSSSASDKDKSQTPSPLTSVGETGGNTPPKVVKADLQLKTEGGKSALELNLTGEDKDNDDVTFGYEWYRNDEPVGTSNSLSEFKRGDRILVKVTPYDGKDYGKTEILTTEIKNTPPKITGASALPFEKGRASYKITALDPDGDPLTYSLQNAPEGMTIDSSTGIVTWNVPAAFKGKADASVVVDDGQGGSVRYDFSATIQ